jgi:hypothetical protein
MRREMSQEKGLARKSAKPLIETHNLQMFVKLQLEERATITNELILTSPTRLLESVRTTSS